MAGADDISQAFVKVSFQDEVEGDPLHGVWRDQGAAKHCGPAVLLHDTLQKLYPNHSIVMSDDWRLNLLQFPRAYAQAISPSELVTQAAFIPLARNSSPIPGVIAESVEYGAFRLAWKTYDFILYIVRWPQGFGINTQNILLHEGPTGPSHDLLLAAGIFEDQLNDEIWVFNQGYWSKDAALWKEIQKASWDDVILEEDFKNAVKKDVYGFFSSEATYKKLALPWKRGLILHGPPGNGKTISIKVIMKECSANGYSPMYVKSFQSYMGEEGSMAAVFAKARQNSPCVVVLEDLDSLINDSNRSFFLNELDGLSSNDGLLVIGTTNHFDRLDPGLSTRPSRFDRKYLFDDPNQTGRLLYVQYWQNKLKDNEDVAFPDTLAHEIAGSTKDFSFAYLKEIFVSSLVTLLTEKEDGHPRTFESIIKEQIKILRKQLDKGAIERVALSSATSTVTSSAPSPIFASLFDGLSDHIQQRRGTINEDALHGAKRSMRALFDGLAENAGRMSHGPILSPRSNSLSDF